MADRQIFETSINKFIAWLECNGTAGYDPYDLWSTRYGIKARRLYYRYGKPAALPVVPLVLADRFIPMAARCGVAKKRYAMSHAHLILGYLDLYSAGVDKETDWLNKAGLLTDELDRIKPRGYSGDCWGYPFDWENRRGLWPKNTPLITVTPYCFEALVSMYQVSGDTKYMEHARSVLRFAIHDLNNTDRPGGAVASSYSPLDRSLVINASAYRAFLLVKGGQLFDDSQATNLGRKLVRFVLQSQRPDGSWPYALEEEGDDFIDHFHTCFVLKNLAKVFDVAGDDDIRLAIERGYAFYKSRLFDDRGLPIPFAAGGNRLLRYSMYDFAEAINLGIVIRDLVPGAYERSHKVAQAAVKQYQLPDGHFVTSIGRAGLADKLAFIRWPQAQMFHALTSLRRSLN